MTGPARPAVVTPVSLDAVLGLLGPEAGLSTSGGDTALTGRKVAAEVHVTGVSLDSASVRRGDSIPSFR